MDFVKINAQDLKNILNEKDISNSHIYMLKDNKPLGYGLIKDSKEIYIYVPEPLRGKGYGNIIFKNILNELKKFEYTRLELTVKSDNIQINKIINSNGEIEILEEQNKTTYIIPLIKKASH